MGRKKEKGRESRGGEGRGGEGRGGEGGEGRGERAGKGETKELLMLHETHERCWDIMHMHLQNNQ